MRVSSVVAGLAIVAAVGQADVRRLSAQRVLGTVRDSASGQPIAGAVVTLRDSAGKLASRTLTGNTGRFAAPIVGNVRQLSVIRIGFTPRIVTIALGPLHQDTTVALTLTELPTLLAGVVVVDQPGCSRRDDRAAAFALWEQARSALLASVVAREGPAGALTTIRFDRRLDRDGERVLSQKLVHDSTNTNRPYVAARQAAAFGTTGYVQRVDADLVYYAPDADDLLDPAFADSHCFSLTRDARSHPAALGLAFQPLHASDSLVDIAGTVWIDSVARALESIDFRFTNIERVAADAGSGGIVSFRTANGVAVIDRWNLHLPEVVREEHRNPLDAYLPTGRVVAVHDVGGVVTTASWRSGTGWTTTEPTLHGRVTWVDDGRPVPHALVRLAGTDDSVFTAADGSFDIPRLLPGPYDVLVADSVVAPTGLAENAPTRVVLDSAGTTAISIRIPKLDAFIRDRCDDAPKGNGNVLMAGRVLLADGEPARDATFDARWNKTGVRALLDDGWRMHGRVNDDGIFVLCKMPANYPIALATAFDSLGVVRRDTLSLPELPIATVRVVLPFHSRRP